MQIGIKCSELIERCNKSIALFSKQRQDLRDEFYRKFHRKAGDTIWSFFGWKTRQKEEETMSEFSHRYLSQFYTSKGCLGELWEREIDVERIRRTALKIGLKDDDIIYLSDSEAALLKNK